jgi:hypothetical protein
VEDTIDLILLQNQLQKKVIGDNTVFIYPSTPAKLKDYQDLKVRSFHLTNADPKQMLTMIKTLLKTKDIFIHEKTNSIVMRDTPDAIRLAEKMVATRLAEPEVMKRSAGEQPRPSELHRGRALPGTPTIATVGQLRELTPNCWQAVERHAQPQAGRWRHQRPCQSAHPGTQSRKGENNDRQPGAGDHQFRDATRNRQLCHNG